MNIVYEYINDEIVKVFLKNKNVESLNRINYRIGYQLDIKVKFKNLEEPHYFGIRLNVNKKDLPLIINNIDKLKKIDKILNDYLLINFSNDKSTCLRIVDNKKHVAFKREYIKNHFLDHLDLFILTSKNQK